jgi:hypothetical protein
MSSIPRPSLVFPKICHLADVLYALDAYRMKHIPCRGRSHSLPTPTGPRLFAAQPRSKAGGVLSLEGARSCIFVGCAQQNGGANVCLRSVRVRRRESNRAGGEPYSPNDVEEVF